MTDWQPIKTAPNDPHVLHVRGVWVHSATTGEPLYFDAHAGYVDDDGDFISTDDDVFGWRADDYTHWVSLPEPPR